MNIRVVLIRLQKVAATNYFVQESKSSYSNESLGRVA